MQLEIRDRVESLLRENEMTLHGLANLAHHDAERLGQAMRGERRFSLTDLAHVAEAFGVTTEWIYTGKDDLPLLNADPAPEARPVAPEGVLLLAQVVTAARDEARVKWTEDEGETIREGIARSVGPIAADGPTSAHDVRDMHLHVTCPLTERWLRVCDVVDLMRAGAFSITART